MADFPQQNARVSRLGIDDFCGYPARDFFKEIGAGAGVAVGGEVFLVLGVACREVSEGAGGT